MFDYLTYLQSQRPVVKPAPILPLAVRKELHRLHWTLIRQSNLNVARECDYKQELACRSETWDSYNIFMVLGIIAHKAAQEFSTGKLAEYGRIGDWWVELFKEWAKADKPKAITHDRKVLTKDQVKQIVYRMGEPRCGTQYLSDLILECLVPLQQNGHVPVHVEHKYRYVDGEGELYPIIFEGTIDYLTRVNETFLFLFDLKFYGILGCFLDDPSGIKKQSLEMDQIRYSRQHRHYGWLARKCGVGTPDAFGFIWPVNMVVYAKNGPGYQKGNTRGSPFVFATVPGEVYCVQYERDLVAFLTAWVAHRPRRYPAARGDELCSSCTYNRWCLKDPTVDTVANAGILDYLR